MVSLNSKYPFRQHISTDSSNPVSRSSEPLKIGSADSQGIASGSNLQSLDGSGDLGTAKPSQQKVIERKAVEVNRKLFLHVCVDIGRGTGLDVIQVRGEDPGQPGIICDQELARQLKIIHERRWPRKYGFFLKLRAIRFVKVSPWVFSHAMLQTVRKEYK